MNLSSDSRLAKTLRWLGTILSILLLIFLLSQQGWEEIGEAVSQIQLWRFIVAIILVIISRFAVTFRWHVLLQATSEKFDWWQSLRVTFAGLFATNFLPTTIGGDVVRLAGAILYGASGAIVAASLVMDRLVGMFGMALMLPWGIGPVLAWLSSNRPNSGSLFPIGLLGIRDFALKKVWQKGLGMIKKVLQSLTIWWKKPGSLIISLIFSGIHMACFFGILGVLLAGLGESISFSLVAGLYSFVYFLTLLPISINGYGLQELSISLIFAQAGGVSMQHSISAALIFRTLTMLASLPGAFFVPGIVSGYRAAKESQISDLKDDFLVQIEESDP